jgi:hypothetical protein
MHPRHAGRVVPSECIRRQGRHMAVKGRASRPGTGATVPLQGRVAPEIRDKARRAADAAGISMAAYLERLVAQDPVDDNGCPTWLNPRNDDQGVLPLDKTA